MQDNVFVKIEASLTKGELFNRKKNIRIMLIVLVLTLISATNTFLMMFFDLGSLRLVLRILSGIFGLPAFILCIILLKSLGVENIQKWVDNAIEVEATITKLDVGNNKFRLEVAFELNGVVHKQQSKPYRKNSVFAKHEDRQEIIYYSSAFDQVMLLKQQ